MACVQTKGTTLQTQTIRYTSTTLHISSIPPPICTSGKDGGRGSWGVWEGHVHGAVFKMDNQQGPTVQHMELGSTLCGSLDGREVWERMDTCVRVAEPFCC